MRALRTIGSKSGPNFSTHGLPTSVLLAIEANKLIIAYKFSLKGKSFVGLFWGFHSFKASKNLSITPETEFSCDSLFSNLEISPGSFSHIFANSFTKPVRILSTELGACYAAFGKIFSSSNLNKDPCNKSCPKVSKTPSLELSVFAMKCKNNATISHFSLWLTSVNLVKPSKGAQ